MNRQRRQFLEKAFKLGGLGALTSLGMSFKAASSFAGGVLFQSGGVTAAGGGCTGFVICQNFEGTGYDNSESWTKDISNGTINEDYTTTALRGSQSCNMIGVDYENNYLISPSFTGASTIYIHFLFRLNNIPAISNNIGPLSVWDGTTEMGKVYITSTGQLKAVAGGGSDANGPTLSEDTLYHIWIDYTVGSGANATVDLYVGTTTSKPGAADASSSDGTSTATPNKIRFAVERDIDMIVDQALVKTTEFTTVDS